MKRPDLLGHILEVFYASLPCKRACSPEHRESAPGHAVHGARDPSSPQRLLLKLQHFAHFASPCELLVPPVPALPF